jgi:hypothetical protein
MSDGKDNANTIRCARCDLQGTIDYSSHGFSGLTISQEEYRRRCHRAADPDFNFNCPDFDAALSKSIIEPPGATR